MEKIHCILQSEIFVIEDCIYYNGNISSNTTFDISIPNDFEISFRLTRASNSGNGAWIILQKDGHDSAMIGQVGGNGTSQCRIYTDTSGSNIPHSTSNTPLNQEALITLRHNGSDYEYSMNDSKQIWTDSYTHSVLKSATIVNSPIKDLKVKPL